jgi:hypothetical protein
MDKQQAWEIVKPHVKALLVDVLDQVIKPALEEAVKASATPIDDAVLAFSEGPLLVALKEQISHI